jgi:glycosyltransferase involved in cell wall biosynthesis
MPGYQGVADWALARLTDRAIAVSASTADFLVHERHVPSARVSIIYNGAPLDEFGKPDPDRGRAVRAELGLPESACVIGSIGRLNAQKGHRYLLEAASIVVARRRDAYFLIVGDGDLLEPLKAQAAVLGLGDRVVFAGHRSDVPAILDALDVFCISSTYEGTPLALFEAMAAGKAVVSTSVDGCREVLQEGVTALLVPTADAPALAAALLRVVEDPSLRTTLAGEARRAAARYDIGESVRRIEAIYDELLARSAEARP